MADLQCFLRISSSCKLVAPSVLSVEIKLAHRWASSASIREIVPHVHLLIRTHFSCKRIHFVVVVFDMVSNHLVSDGGRLHLLHWWTRVPVQNHIKRDFLFSSTHVKALVDCRVDIDVPNGTAVYKPVSSEAHRRERSWN